MIGGLFKSSSRVAMLAAAGLLSGGVAAQAADLGGNCCADLEERVAELEATTARKGNRRVSLTVSGHVHEAIVFWNVDNVGNNLAGPDDESNVYIGTHNSSRSRFSFRGSANINADWSAGFLMEFGVRRNSLHNTTQNDPRVTSGLDIRHEALWVRSRTYGTVWLGWSSAAADGITEICLGCGLGNGPDFNDDMSGLLAGNGVSFAAHGSASGAFSGEGDRRNVVRYISPTFAGFSLSASAGGDDYVDVALRYAGEFGAFRVAAGVAYAVDTNAVDSAGLSGTSCTNASATDDRDCQSIGASASVQHTPTGLYIAGAYGQNTDELAAANADTNIGWHVTAGINTRWNSLGNTNLWGMYNVNEREIGLNSELTVWGVGIEQNIDAAAMNVYLWYKHMDAEVGGASTGEMDQVVLGARVRF